jgi:hypothetical protein
MTSFIDYYVSYHSMKTVAQPVYAQHLIMQQLGHCLGRESKNIIAPSEVRHNSYLCLVGTSSVSKKTTAQEKVASRLIPTLNIGPKNFSPEGLLNKMQLYPSMLLPMGEFSTVLRGISNGGHMTNFKEIANDLFTCPADYKKQLVSKEYYIKNPYLSINSTITESELFPYLKNGTMEGGFFPRWRFVYQKDPEHRRRENLPETVDCYEAILRNIITKLYYQFKEHPMTYHLDEEALDKFDEISIELEEDSEWESIRSFVARYEEYMIADADILTLSDDLGKFLESTELTELTKLTEITKLTNDSTTIDKILSSNEWLVNLVKPVNSVNSVNLLRSYELMKPCLRYAVKLATHAEEDDSIRKVKNQMDKLQRGDWISYSDLIRKSHVSPCDKFKLIMHTLKEREEVEEEERTSGEGQSKKESKWYKRGMRYE